MYDDPRTTYRAVNVRANTIEVGEVVKLGGVFFDRMSPKGPWIRSSAAPKPAWRSIHSVDAWHRIGEREGWMVLGVTLGDPGAENRIWALLRPYDLVPLQVKVQR